ncbi:MAG: HIT domain-containing protein [Bacteroidota bacterium]
MASCIFCEIVAGRAPSWKVLETADAYAFLDINPVNPYHTLVIPRQHYVNVMDVAPAAWQGVMQAVKKVVDLYTEKLGMEHAQIVHSAGAAGQQDVFHLHAHVVPRHAGDGQNIKWKTHPEMRSQYDQMIARLQ